VALLALVAGQDVEPAEGSDGMDGRWRIARKVAEDRVISVNDPQARHTRKSPENRRDGYRAHLAACPETGIITGEQLTQAAGEENSDAAVAAQFVAAQAARGGPAHEWYGDTAYGTGDLRAALDEAGHTAVIRPWPARPAVEGGFTVDDFTADETAGTRDLPGRCHPSHHRPPDRDLRRGVPRLPAACPVHREQDRPDPDPAPPRRAAARRPPGLGCPASPTRGLQEIPAQRRAGNFPGRQPRRAAP
jgi:hypothetical protein